MFILFFSFCGSVLNFQQVLPTELQGWRRAVLLQSVGDAYGRQPSSTPLLFLLPTKMLSFILQIGNDAWLCTLQIHFYFSHVSKREWQPFSNHLKCVFHTVRTTLFLQPTTVGRTVHQDSFVTGSQSFVGLGIMLYLFVTDWSRCVYVHCSTVLDSMP